MISRGWNPFGYISIPSLIPWARKFDKVTPRRYGIIAVGDDKGTQVEKILRFFGVASPEAFDRTWIQPRVSFRGRQDFTVSGYLRDPHCRPTPVTKQRD